MDLWATLIIKKLSQLIWQEKRGEQSVQSRLPLMVKLMSSATKFRTFTMLISTILKNNFITTLVSILSLAAFLTMIS